MTKIENKMNFGSSSSSSSASPFVFSMCVKKLLLVIFVLIVVIPSICVGQPVKKIPAGVARKSCGRNLVARVDRICQSRGGHMTYTNRGARRVRRGIVDECCTNKCSDHHIYSYCSKSSETDSSYESPLPIEVIEPKSHETRSVPENIVQPNVEIVRSEDNNIIPKNLKPDYVEQIVKSIPIFEFGTVPPEFRNSRYIPSRIRISNY